MTIHDLWPLFTYLAILIGLVALINVGLNRMDRTGPELPDYEHIADLEYELGIGMSDEERKAYEDAHLVEVKVNSIHSRFVAPRYRYVLEDGTVVGEGWTLTPDQFVGGVQIQQLTTANNAVASAMRNIGTVKKGAAIGRGPAPRIPPAPQRR